MSRAWLLLAVLSFQTLDLAASELSIVGGKGVLSDLKSSEGTTEFSGSGFFGARYEKDFFFIVGVENNLLLSGNTLAPKGSAGETGLFYTGNLVLNFPVDRVVPNIVLGLGVLHRFGDSYPDVGTAFLTDWGFGVKLRDLAGPAGLRLDYRRIGVHGVEDQTVTEQEFSAGLLVSF